ncbi:hypothetical protein [Vibrio ziniensis]|uniref:Uncharacterized protein n=1 Tax=Vibrio ziniensis TaxID=2711221 RepID=A0A6G7CHB4_9VIBR|nr:hypothetical protein [Vibrio ziniensis]QIH41492.1 hypothetical protein G5S32_05570 [Vibrio ziniensis]
MNNFDIEETLTKAAVAYFGNDHNLGMYLLKGCLRRLSLLPLNAEQASYLATTISTINEMIKLNNFTGLADVIMFELIKNFPDFDSLLAQDSAEN